MDIDDIYLRYFITEDPIMNEEERNLYNANISRIEFFFNTLFIICLFLFSFYNKYI